MDAQHLSVLLTTSALASLSLRSLTTNLLTNLLPFNATAALLVLLNGLVVVFMLLFWDETVSKDDAPPRNVVGEDRVRVRSSATRQRQTGSAATPPAELITVGV